MTNGLYKIYNKKGDNYNYRLSQINKDFFTSSTSQTQNTSYHLLIYVELSNYI